MRAMPLLSITRQRPQDWSLRLQQILLRCAALLRSALATALAHTLDSSCAKGTPFVHSGGILRNCNPILLL